MNGINRMCEFSWLPAARTTNAARGRRKTSTKQLPKAANPIRRPRGVKFRIWVTSAASIMFGRRAVRASFVFGPGNVVPNDPEARDKTAGSRLIRTALD